MSVRPQRGQDGLMGKVVAPHVSHVLPMSSGSVAGQVKTSGAKATCGTRLSSSGDRTQQM